jgi:hypothetical protein
MPPTAKGVRRRDLNVAPAIRSEQRSPRLEIQQRRTANIVALKQYRLRLGAIRKLRVPFSIEQVPTKRSESTEILTLRGEYIS